MGRHRHHHHNHHGRRDRNKKSRKIVIWSIVIFIIFVVTLVVTMKLRKPACKPKCLNGGTCDGGICKCPPTWSGLDCSEHICTIDCLNGGECEVGNTCQCQLYWRGHTCGLANCDPACENGGTCLEGNLCHCAGNWTGKNCLEPQCSKGCNNGGTCIDVDVCECPIFYTGATCDDYFCPATWHLDAPQRLCLKIFDNPAGLNRTEAAKMCREEGAELLTTYSLEEYDSAMDMMFKYPPTQAWIGLTYDPEFGYFFSNRKLLDTDDFKWITEPPIEQAPIQCVVAHLPDLQLQTTNCDTTGYGAYICRKV